MKKLILLFVGLALLTMKAQAQTVTDYDSNIYNTVTIGTQTWLKENLKVTHYCNGNPIPNIPDSAKWQALTTHAYCNYNNNSDTANIYGRLYNWFAVNDSRKLCPLGWHVASDAEWTVLTNYLGGIYIAGGKLKETGITHWALPNTGATNIGGFTALPGGGRYWKGFKDIRSFGYWWSSTSHYSYSAWNRAITYDSTWIYTTGYNKRAGFSVRCICDSTTSSVKEIYKIKGIIIYPNPATDKLNITSKNGIKIETVNIYNQLGQIVLHRNEIRKKIDISTLGQGIYIIEVISNKSIIREKLVIK